VPSPMPFYDLPALHDGMKLPHAGRIRGGLVFKYHPCNTRTH
jgi:hypothetical protein